MRRVRHYSVLCYNFLRRDDPDETSHINCFKIAILGGGPAGIGVKRLRTSEFFCLDVISHTDSHSSCALGPNGRFTWRR